MSAEDYNLQRMVDAAYEKVMRSLAAANTLPDSGGQVNLVLISLLTVSNRDRLLQADNHHEGKEEGKDTEDNQAEKEEAYEVETVLAWRRKDTGSLEYLVKWKDTDGKTWEPADNVTRHLNGQV